MDFIKRNWLIMSDAEIGKVTGYAKGTVVVMRNKLGLSRSQKNKANRLINKKTAEIINEIKNRKIGGVYVREKILKKYNPQKPFTKVESGKINELIIYQGRKPVIKLTVEVSAFKTDEFKEKKEHMNFVSNDNNKLTQDEINFFKDMGWRVKDILYRVAGKYGVGCYA